MCGSLVCYLPGTATAAAGAAPTSLMVLWMQEVAALELQAAELDEASSSQQKAHLEHKQQATAAAQQRDSLVAAVAAAQQQLDQLQRQAQVSAGV